MRYEYLHCDNPDCNNKLDLARNEQAQWITLSSGQTDFHFCNYPCLVSFANDADAPTKSLDKFGRTFGYRLE